MFASCLHVQFTISEKQRSVLGCWRRLSAWGSKWLLTYCILLCSQRQWQTAAVCDCLQDSATDSATEWRYILNVVVYWRECFDVANGYFKSQSYSFVCACIFRDYWVLNRRYTHTGAFYSNIYYSTLLCTEIQTAADNVKQPKTVDDCFYLV